MLPFLRTACSSASFHRARTRWVSLIFLARVSCITFIPRRKGHDASYWTASDSLALQGNPFQSDTSRLRQLHSAYDLAAAVPMTTFWMQACPDSTGLILNAMLTMAPGTGHCKATARSRAENKMLDSSSTVGFAPRLASPNHNLCYQRLHYPCIPREGEVQPIHSL